MTLWADNNNWDDRRNIQFAALYESFMFEIKAYKQILGCFCSLIGLKKFELFKVTESKQSDSMPRLTVLAHGLL